MRRPRTRECLFDAGRSRRQFVRIHGDSGPVVVFESASGGTADDWNAIAPQLARAATVFTYDRLGHGRSSPGPLPRTAERMAEELRRLLRRAKVPPPYILVGSSLGGLIVRLFADRFRPEVAGLVLVESTHERLAEALPPRVWKREARGLDKSEDPEIRALGASYAAVAEIESLGDLPLIVITATDKWREIRDAKLRAETNEAWVVLQRSLASLSSRGEQWLVECGHGVHVDRPEVIIRAVRQLLKAPDAVAGR